MRRWTSRWWTENMPMWPATCSIRTVPPLSACMSLEQLEGVVDGGLGGDCEVEAVLVDELAQGTLEVVGDLSRVVPGRTGTGPAALDDQHATVGLTEHEERGGGTGDPGTDDRHVGRHVVIERAGGVSLSSCSYQGECDLTSRQECTSATAMDELYLSMSDACRC